MRLEPSTAGRAGLAAVAANVRDLPRALAPSAWAAGLVAVLVAYTGPLVLVFQAAEAAGLDRARLASWIWALTVGSGVVSLLLCLWYRQPIVAAWSVAGSALLVTSLGQFRLSEAVGAYLLAGIATALLGWSGLFGRLLALVPAPVVMGMLAGVLLRFGVGLFAALPLKPLVVLSALATFLVLRLVRFRAPTVAALVAGLAASVASGDARLAGLSLELAVPVWTPPELTLAATFTLALPLFVLAIASQDAPGIAVLRAAGYRAPADGPILLTGLASVLTAPLGGHGLNLAAVMAVMCSGPEAHRDPDLRYGAGVAAGVWFVLFGTFGATAAALFAALPKELIAAVAGLAMVGPLVSSLSGAMADPGHREGALFALLLGAADVSLFGIGAPFWALVVGVLVSRLAPRRGSA